MKILEFQNELNYFDATAHMIVTRPIDGKEHEELIAAGLIDVDQVTRGLAARALKGEFLHVRPSRYESIEMRVKCDKNQYRLVHKAIGKVTHTLILHKSAVDDILEGDRARTLLIPNVHGDIATLFAKRFANDFSLPFQANWGNALWNACREQELVEELNVWTHPSVQQWADLRAYQLSPDFTEEKAKEVLSNLLADGVIELPEGITEAPAISEILGDVDNEEEQDMLTYLQGFAPHLAANIEEIAEAAHDLDKPIHPAIASMKRTPFLAQAHVAQAALNGFQDQKGVIISSDMGTGKSITSLGIINALASMKTTADKVVNEGRRGLTILMLVPAITLPKWVEDEIKKTLYDPLITVFRNWKDIVHWREKRKKHPLQAGKIEILLLGRDTSKLGMPKKPALIFKKEHVYAIRPKQDEYKPKKTEIVVTASGVTVHAGSQDRGRVVRLHDVWLCPECYAVQTKTDEQSIKEAKEGAGDDDFEMFLELKLGFEDLATGVRPYEATGVGKHPVQRNQYKFLKNVGEYHCSACNANLTRDVRPEVEKVSNLSHRRLQPSWFIQRYLKHKFDLLVVDEVHEYSGLSGQGQSLGAIITAAKTSLFLTGTLSKGTASSLYYLLWRLVPHQMLQLGFDHKSLGKFVSTFGAQEQRGRYSEDQLEDAGTYTKRKLVMNPPKEIPGLSPKLFASLLGDKCLFLELPDLGIPLVELEEKPVFVDLDDEHQLQYARFHARLDEKMKRAYMLGNKHAYARFIPAVINAANQPHLPQLIELGDETVCWDPTMDETELNAKERRLLSDIQEDLAKNRRCAVFVRFSGEYKQDVRIHEILTRAGIRSRVLKASIAPQERVAWLAKAVEDNVQVIVGNYALCSVGIDMLDFPSINFFQLPDQINALRQTSRRSWRIGQNKRCTVRIYIANGTYEMVHFDRMMQRRLSAMMLEGRADRSDLASFGVRDEFSSSTYSIANCLLDVNDLEQRWKSIADKDIQEGVVMLKEEEFKSEIAAAMKRLAAETRRAAGLPDVEPVQLVPKTGDESELDLFNLPEFEGTHTLVPEPSEPYIPLTVGDMRKQMGLVVKAKKKQNVSDDQILLFAL